jgi:NitT/TauT family transport system substrate-binding protein
VNQHPDSAAALIVKYGILPEPEVAVNAIPGSNLKFKRADEVKKEIEDYLNVFYKLNPDIVGGKMPDEDFIYR